MILVEGVSVAPGHLFSADGNNRCDREVHVTDDLDVKTIRDICSRLEGVNIAQITLPGFRIPLGSSADLIKRIVAISAALLE